MHRRPQSGQAGGNSAGPRSLDRAHARIRHSVVALDLYREAVQIDRTLQSNARRASNPAGHACFRSAPIKWRVRHENARSIGCTHVRYRYPASLACHASTETSFSSGILPWASAYSARMDPRCCLGCPCYQGGQPATSISEDTACAARPLISRFHIAL